MEEQTKGCVLFADVSGSTKLHESVGDTAAHAAIDLCVKFFRAHVFGDTVNLAARPTEMASKGQVITFDPIQKMDHCRLYSIPVKGKEREVDICELMWSDTDDATTLVAHRATTDAGDSLRLVCRGRVVVLSPERRSIDGDREIVLRREEALLRAHGFIALGQSRSTATEFVEFFCE